MRSLRNFLWFAVGVLLVAAPMFAFAGSFTWSGGYPDAISACVHYTGADASVVTVQPVGSTYAGAMYCFVNGKPGGSTVSPDPGAVCPAPNTVDSTGACVPPPVVDCSSGKPTDFWFDTGPLGANNKSPTSDGFCGLSVKPPPAISQCYPTTTGPTGRVMCHYFATRDGSHSPADVPQPSPAPSADTPLPPTPVKTQADPNYGCPGGTSLVGYDSANIPMCAGMGTDPGKAPAKVDTAPTQTTTNPDGSTTTKDSTASTNSDGSQTTRTATCTIATNGGKSCTTTTATGKTPTGSQGKNDTDPKTGDDTKGDNATSLDGELYAKGSKTFQDVMNHWNSAVSSAPFIGAAQGFLSAQVSGGSCPSWVAAVPYLKLSVDVGQYFCAPGTAEMFNIVGIGVMLGAAYIAFRIAFL